MWKNSIDKFLFLFFVEICLFFHPNIYLVGIQRCHMSQMVSVSQLHESGDDHPLASVAWWKIAQPPNVESVSMALRGARAAYVC